MTGLGYAAALWSATHTLRVLAVHSVAAAEYACRREDWGTVPCRQLAYPTEKCNMTVLEVCIFMARVHHDGRRRLNGNECAVRFAARHRATSEYLGQALLPWRGRNARGGSPFSALTHTFTPVTTDDGRRAFRFKERS